MAAAGNGSDFSFGDYDRIANLFSDAEAEIKSVEQQRILTVVPAINQLRYAGFHVLQSLVDDQVERAKHIGKAESHAKRSMHDALEAGVFGSLKTIEGFKDDYRFLELPAIWPEYVDKRARIEAIRREMLGLRPRNHVSHNDKLRGYNQELYAICQEFEDRRPILNEELRRRNKRVLFQCVGLGAAVVAAVATLIALFL
jgi:hypothetical protein